MKKAIFVFVLWSAGLLLPGVWGAGTLQAQCEICESHMLTASWCRAIKPGETGVTQCIDSSGIGGTWCTEAGDWCSRIDVGGGGGGGGGAGGGGTCIGGTSGCPAECFSCGRSGGGANLTVDPATSSADSVK
jgi:hypothetical protein